MYTIIYQNCSANIFSTFVIFIAGSNFNNMTLHLKMNKRQLLSITILSLTDEV